MPKPFLLVLFLVPLCLNAQVILHEPNYDHATTSDVKLVQIEMAEDFTVVYFSFKMPEDFIYGGWVAAKKEMFLRDVKTNDRFFLQRVTNIPLLPERHYFSRSGEQLDFEIYFDPIDLSKTTHIDLIEDPKGGLNFYNVSLKDKPQSTNRLISNNNKTEEVQETQKTVQEQEKIEESSEVQVTERKQVIESSAIKTTEQVIQEEESSLDIIKSTPVLFEASEQPVPFDKSDN